MISKNENSEVSWMKLIVQGGSSVEQDSVDSDLISPIEIDLVDSDDVEWAS